MALRCNAHVDRLNLTTPPTSLQNWSYRQWWRPRSDLDHFSNVFNVSHLVNNRLCQLVTAADGTTLRTADGAALQLDLGALVIDTWYFLALSMGPSNAITAWIAARSASGLTKFTGTQLSSPTALTLAQWGSCDNSSSNFSDGEHANAAVYDGVWASDAAVEAERWRTDPVRTSGLIGSYRFTSNALKLVDQSGNGHTLVAPAAGTWEDADPPFVDGAGAVTVGDWSAAGAGSVVVSGAGALQVGDWAAAGAGSSVVSGAGAVVIGDFSAAGAGSVVVSGAGALVVGDFVVAGEGTVLPAGVDFDCFPGDAGATAQLVRSAATARVP